MSSSPDSRVPVLTSERLILRTPREHDAPALRDYYVRNDDRFARWREARSGDLEEHVRWVATNMQPGFGDIAFVAFANGERDLVAVVTLHGFSAGDSPQAMLSYTVDRAYEGRGYARPSLRVCLGLRRTRAT